MTLKYILRPYGTLQAGYAQHPFILMLSVNTVFASESDSGREQ